MKEYIMLIDRYGFQSDEVVDSRVKELIMPVRHAGTIIHDPEGLPVTDTNRTHKRLFRDTGRRDESRRRIFAEVEV